MDIFIADDSDKIRNSLAHALLDIPRVRICGQTGEKSRVVDLVRGSAPDLIVLDLRMTGGNSFGLIRTIKQALPDTILVMFTEYAYSLYRDRCLELGADYFFEKTMESEKLINLIQKLSTTHPSRADSSRSGQPRAIKQASGA